MENNELIHYGVLGMKWGVRRSQAKINRIQKKAKRKNWSEDATVAAEIRTKKVKQMSNTELKKLNERTRLENEYKNLNSRKQSAGKKFVQEIVRETAKDTVKSYTTPLAKKGVEKGAKWVAKQFREARSGE